MDEKQFHTVETESLKQITVNDILIGNNIAPNKVDYSVSVPTQNQRLPHRSRDAWLEVEVGGLNSMSLPEVNSGYRGRIGGC